MTCTCSVRTPRLSAAARHALVPHLPPFAVGSAEEDASQSVSRRSRGASMLAPAKRTADEPSRKTEREKAAQVPFEKNAAHRPSSCWSDSHAFVCPLLLPSSRPQGKEDRLTLWRVPTTQTQAQPWPPPTPPAPWQERDRQ